MMNVYSDFCTPSSYTKEQNDVWRDLILQQTPLVKKYACSEYLIGLTLLNLSKCTVPNVKEVSLTLEKLTGWRLYPVGGLITSRKFFLMLANKTFPVVTKIRRRDEIDFYSGAAPDVFQELFGHCPLLTNNEYAKSLQKLGEVSLQCNDEKLLKLAKIFWVTYEFGLLKTTDGIKAYGAAILPSRAELRLAMEDSGVPKEIFSLDTKISASLQGNAHQSVFYIIDSLKTLYDLTLSPSLALAL